MKFQVLQKLSADYSNMKTCFEPDWVKLSMFYVMDNRNESNKADISTIEHQKNW